MRQSDQKQTSALDRTISACLFGLVLVLPIAHTMTIRMIFLFLPLALWIWKIAVKKEVIFVKNRLLFPLSVFSAFVVISYFSAIDPAYTLREIRGELGTNILIFLLVMNNINTMKDAERLITALLIGSLLHGAYSLFLYFSGPVDIMDLNLKVGGLTGGYITYSVFLVIAIPFMAYRAMNSPMPVKGFYVLLLLFNIFLLFLTHQRGALLALMAEAFVFLFLMGKWKSMAVLALLLVFSVQILPDNIVYHGQKGVNVEASQIKNYRNTIESRIGLWRFTMGEIAAHPFEGIGFGRRSFQKKYEQYRDTDLWHAHNTFLNLAIQLGVQGLLSFLFLLYVLLSALYKAFKAANENSRFYAAMTALITGFFVRNMFDDLYVDDSAQLLWVLIAAAMAVFSMVDKFEYQGFISRFQKFLSHYNKAAA